MATLIPKTVCQKSWKTNSLCIHIHVNVFGFFLLHWSKVVITFESIDNKLKIGCCFFNLENQAAAKHLIWQNERKRKKNNNNNNHSSGSSSRKSRTRARIWIWMHTNNVLVGSHWQCLQLKPSRLRTVNCVNLRQTTFIQINLEMCSH